MKKIAQLLCIVVFGCCTAQTTKERIFIKYEAITRGSFIEITTSLDSISYKDTNTTKTVQLSKKATAKISSLISALKLHKLKEFQVSSINSARDAALQATFSIIKNGKSYKTLPFDHGNPPKEIKFLIEFLFKNSEIE